MYLLTVDQLCKVSTSNTHLPLFVSLQECFAADLMQDSVFILAYNIVTTTFLDIGSITNWCRITSLPLTVCSTYNVTWNCNHNIPQLVLFNSPSLPLSSRQHPPPSEITHFCNDPDTSSNHRRLGLGTTHSTKPRRQEHLPSQVALVQILATSIHQSQLNELQAW